MTIFHRLQGSLFIYFIFLKFFIYFSEILYYPYDVTNSYITNCHTNLAYMGLAKIMVA